MLIIAIVGALVAAASGQPPCELATARRDAPNYTSCVSCHDGSAGPAIGLGDARHMVGRDYGSSWLASRRVLKAIPHGSPVVLHEGRVTCTSCHDPESPLRKHVAAPDICAECHAK